MMVYISRIKESGGPGCGGISMKKVFIDGSAGTTGLRIFDRLQARSDIQLLTLPEAERKDEGRRRQLLNEADAAFLCLPDAAAEEAASLLNENSVEPCHATEIVEDSFIR